MSNQVSKASHCPAFFATTLKSAMNSKSATCDNEAYQKTGNEKQRRGRGQDGKATTLSAIMWYDAAKCGVLREQEAVA